MEDIIYEIIGGAIIIGIIIVVINVFRANSDVVRNAAESQTELDSISIVDSVGYDGSIYNGAKIKDAISFAELNQGIIVKFTYDSNPIEYRAGNIKVGANEYVYASSPINIQAMKDKLLIDDSKYKLDISYFATGGAVRKKGDLDIVRIEFKYTKQP